MPIGPHMELMLYSTYESRLGKIEKLSNQF